MAATRGTSLAVIWLWVGYFLHLPLANKINDFPNAFFPMMGFIGTDIKEISIF
jgi:hypothetical protein